MLRYKGIEFTRLDLPNMTHKAILPLLRYRGVDGAGDDASTASGSAGR